MPGYFNFNKKGKNDHAAFSQIFCRAYAIHPCILGRFVNRPYFRAYELPRFRAFALLLFCSK
jgi:hypothetical protein